MKFGECIHKCQKNPGHNFLKCRENGRFDIDCCARRKPKKGSCADGYKLKWTGTFCFRKKYANYVCHSPKVSALQSASTQVRKADLYEAVFFEEMPAFTE